MKIELKRVYTIEYPGTAAEFIEFVDRELRMRHDGTLDSLDMGDAVEAATQIYDGGDMTTYVDDGDREYNYIDCPDSETLMWYFPDVDRYLPTRAGASYIPIVPAGTRTDGWCLDCGQWEISGVIRHWQDCPNG